MRDKRGGPSKGPLNKYLKPSNVFKDYGWFLIRDDKHMLLKISTYPWLKKNGILKHGPKKKLFKIANKDEYFWNEGAKLWTDGNMKFLRREAIPSVNVEDHVKYKYVEQSLGLNHDEELQVNASILGATEFAEYALVHPNVRKICFL